MKTTFRNEINHMEEDFNIDEITVREDLGIDPNTIKNKVMQQILRREGFEYCGLIQFDGGPKLAYEWDRSIGV